MESKPSLTPNQLAEVQTLLSAALALASAEREAFMRDRCRADTSVCREVRSLLGLHQAAEGFLDQSLPALLGALPPAEINRLGQLLADRYRLQTTLAQSGFATVYYATDLRAGEKPVVVKVLDRLSDREAIQAAFQTELRALSALHHPSLVGITDTGETGDGAPFLVLPYVPGLTLRETLEAGPLGAERVRRIIGQAAKALAIAHREGISHLDVKPENIVISDPGTSDERVTLIDFGIARIRDAGAGAAGSEWYMAPEQRAAPGPLCDIYSLGVVAFEALTGRLPDRSRPPTGQLRGVAWRGPILQALESAPERRPVSAAALAGALTDISGKYRIAGILAGLAVAGVLAFWFNRPPPEEYAKVIPLVTSLQEEDRPSFSPDGSVLYYVDGSKGRASIFRTRIGGGEPVPFVQNDRNNDHPHVSPDGKRLGFIRGGGKEFIFSVRQLEGGGAVAEMGPARDIQSWTWAADGKKIAASVHRLEQNANGLSRLDLASHHWTDILNPADATYAYINPSISPDGRWLAFLKNWNGGAATDIFIASIDAELRLTSVPRPITNEHIRITSMQWTPDSGELVFIQGPLGLGTLWRIGIGGGTPKPVPDAPPFLSRLAIPRKAWKMALSIDRSDANIFRLHIPTRTTTQVFASSYSDDEAQLSPDGKLICFSSSRSGEPQVWMADADGSNPRQITRFKSPDLAGAMWARDSRNLIVHVRLKDEGHRIYIAPAEPNPKLTLLLEDARGRSLSPDGKRLYFTRDVGNRRQLWVTEFPDSRQTKAVPGDRADFPLESPDGKWLFFARRNEREGLWRQPLSGGPAVRVVDQLYRRSLFAPGKQGLFYVATPAGEQRQALFFQPYGDGRTTRLYTFDREVGWGLTLSPDEQDVLFTQFDSGNVDLMLIPSFR